MNFDSLLDIVEAVVKNVGPEGTHHLGGGWYGQKEGIALYRKVDGKFKKVKPGEAPSADEMKKIRMSQPPGKVRANDVLSSSDHAVGFDVVAPKSNVKPKKQAVQSVDNHGESPAFNEDLKDEDDKRFYARRSVLSNFQRFRLDMGDNGGKYPKKYDQILDRMLNTNVNKDKLYKKMSYYTEKTDAGKGSLSSKAGELMALMSSTMDDGKAKQFFSKIGKRVDEIEKEPRAKCAITQSWVEAAAKNRRAIKRALRDKEIIGAAWDVGGDVNALGVDYKDSEDSTDAFVKTVDKKGLVEVHEISLKKDNESNFKNSWFDKLTKKVYGDQKPPTDIDRDAYKTAQHKKLAAVFDSPEIQRDIEKHIKNKRDLTTLEKFRSGKDGKNVTIVSSVQSAELYNILKKIDTRASKAAVRDVDGDRKTFQTAATKVIMSDHQMVDALLDSVRKEFPLNSVALGRETMIIGDKVFDQKALEKMFGTTDIDSIRENLRVKNNRFGRPVIVYSMTGSKKTIEISDLEIREKPLGSGDFALNLSIAEGFTEELKKLD